MNRTLLGTFAILCLAPVSVTGPHGPRGGPHGTPVDPTPFDPVAKKCDQRVPEPLIAVDGELRPDIATLDDLNDAIPREDMSYVDIVCMDEADSTFNKSSGIPVVSVWTTESPVGRTPETLEAVVRAQDERFERYGAFGENAEILPRIEHPGIQLAVHRLDSGWVAEASVERFLQTCFVYDGVEVSLHPLLESRRPRCIETSDVRSATWRPSNQPPGRR